MHLRQPDRALAASFHPRAPPPPMHVLFPSLVSQDNDGFQGTNP